MEILEKFLSYAEKKGIKKAEVFYQEIEKEHLSISRGEVENFQSARETGIGIRIIKDNKQGFAYTNNLEKIEEVFEKALSSAEIMPSDENWVLSENFHGKDLKEYPEDPPITKKIEALKETEKKIFSKDSKVKSVRNVIWEGYRSKVYILNTLGTNLEYNYQYQYVYTDVGVSDGKEERGAWEFKSGKTWYDLDLEDLVDKVTWKALSLLGAKPKPSQRTTIILPPSQSQELLEVFSQAFSAEAVQKGKSILKGLLGEKIASDKLTIIEDPTYERAFIKRDFDDEGVKTKEKYLIKDGYLVNYLYNLYTANKEGKESTGNGVRDSFKGLPKVGFFNLYIKPGEKTEDEIIKSTKNGFYVFSLMGLHLADPISGDFSLGADGLWIRDGELAEPVCEVTISGNLKDLLKSIAEVGKDVKFDNIIVSPTLRLEDIMVAGK